MIFQGVSSTYLIYSGFINYRSLLCQQLLLNLSRSCFHALQGRKLSSGLCSQGSALDVSLSGSWIITGHIVLNTVLYVWCLMRQQNWIYCKVLPLMHSWAGMACKQHYHKAKGLQQQQIRRIVTAHFKLSCGNARKLRYQGGGGDTILALQLSPVHIQPLFPAPGCCSHSTQEDNRAGGGGYVSEWDRHEPHLALRRTRAESGGESPCSRFTFIYYSFLGLYQWSTSLFIPTLLLFMGAMKRTIPANAAQGTRRVCPRSQPCSFCWNNKHV